MRSKLLIAAAVAASAAMSFTGCSGGTPEEELTNRACELNDAFSPQFGSQLCTVELPERALTAPNGCAAALTSCNGADRKALETAVDCWDKLEMCSTLGDTAYTDAVNACLAGAHGISQSCKDAFFDGKEPRLGEEPGVDAGPQPDTEDLGALDLFAAADETTMALAWTQSQNGPVSTWEIYSSNAADLPLDPQQLTEPAKRYSTQTAETNERRNFFVYGYTSEGEVTMGVVETPDAGMDAGMPLCDDMFDCPTTEICDLAAGCVEKACSSPDECPAGYTCQAGPGLCIRVVTPDAGMADAGVADAGVQEVPRPFISELVSVVTGAPQFSADRRVSDFPANSPTMVAFDTARAFMLMEQENQIFGYYTQDRGKTFKGVPVDPSGRYPRLAYEPQSETVFACYSALSISGVRVRVSENLGQSFRPGVVDLVNELPADGGFADPILDCAIAPWQDGMALVAAIEGGDRVRVWTVNKDLQVIAGPETVFQSDATYFSPRELAVATAPSEFMAHVLFTTTRTLSGGGNDPGHILAVSRTPTSGGVFTAPKNVQGFAAPSTEQSRPAVVIDPATKRAVAAFASNEPIHGVEGQRTVYVSMYNPVTGNWSTGPDLSIFYSTGAGTYPVMPEKTTAQKWVAGSPSLAIDKKGRITLAFLAGREVTGQTGNFQLNPWAVNFDLEKPSMGATTSKGWFGTGTLDDGDHTAKRVSTTRVANVAGRTTAGPVLAADQQISTWMIFIEGVGQLGDQPNRPVISSKPQ